MKERVLLVESSSDLADNLKVLLSSLRDFQIVGHSDSGLDAMRMMSALSPDILILDLSLPDMTAIDIARWAQRLFPGTNLVLLSTYDLPEYRAAATRLKGSAFVSKAELRRKMPQVLRRMRRKHLARERERGGIVVTKWYEQLRKMAVWVENTASARNQAPIWRLIHLGMVVLSLELVIALSVGGSAPGIIAAGWVMLIIGIAHDFYTLGKCAGPIAVTNNGVSPHVQ